MVSCSRSASPDAVATVNGKEIKRLDLERRYLDYRHSRGGNEPEPSPEQANLVRLSILRDMIDSQILQDREQAKCGCHR